MCCSPYGDNIYVDLSIEIYLLIVFAIKCIIIILNIIISIDLIAKEVRLYKSKY